MCAGDTSSPLHIGLIGCGHMGRAMVNGWLSDQDIGRISILDPSPINIGDARIHHAAKAIEFTPHIPTMDMLVLAVKPQIMADICAEIKTDIPPGLPLLSIAAGFSLASFYQTLPKEQVIIRAMPNTPGAIGKGITGALRTPAASTDTITTVNTLLACLGDVLWVSDEDQINMVTALSGSGPAYVFYFIEALEKAGTKAGLSAEDAKILARQTVIGGAALAEQDAHTAAQTLRENVTSPGGTTQAALDILMNGDFENIIEDAIQSALKRARELS